MGYNIVSFSKLTLKAYHPVYKQKINLGHLVNLSNKLLKYKIHRIDTIDYALVDWLIVTQLTSN